MSKNNRNTAIYVRVSTAGQSIASQKKDLEKWAEAHSEDIGPVRWFIDKASGKSMDRPEWNKLYSAIQSHKISRLVVWRLDRLGRTASGLCKLFEELQAHRVRLISLKDSVDLGTPAGRLIANVLASVASYETEVRGERVKAGQAAARAEGKCWGGSAKGRLCKTNIEQVRQIVRMKDEGQKISYISRAVGVDRPGVYRILRRVKDGHIKI